METPSKRRKHDLHSLERGSPAEAVTRKGKPCKPWPKASPKPESFGGHHSKAGECRCCHKVRSKHQRGGYCEQCINRCRQFYGHRSFSKLQPDQAQHIAAAVDKHMESDQAVRPAKHGNRALVDATAQLAELLPRLEAAIARMESFSFEIPSPSPKSGSAR